MNHTSFQSKATKSSTHESSAKENSKNKQLEGDKATQENIASHVLLDNAMDEQMATEAFRPVDCRSSDDSNVNKFTTGSSVQVILESYDMGRSSSGCNSINKPPEITYDSDDVVGAQSTACKNNVVRSHLQLKHLSERSMSDNTSSLRHQKSSFFRRSSVLLAPPRLEKMYSYFKESITAEGRLNIRFYLLAYREIVKFLSCLGTILSFASRDIQYKVERMDELLSSEQKECYYYLDSLLQYEIAAKIVTQEGCDKHQGRGVKRSGTRIMFRLHQALAFLVRFFTNIQKEPSAKMHTVVHEAYKATISKNHSWLVRKTANLAFHAIPSRGSLIKRLDHTGCELLIMSQLKDITDVATEVYILSGTIFNQNSKIAYQEPATPQVC